MHDTNKDPIRAVPTNIITGFLGVGKTSTILHLLQHKPEAERWAILVNEFGTIGIDGALLQGQSGEAPGIFIREVPGGCMCCAAGGLPMKTALNQLLKKSRPDRLLIEPTGLGHPNEVLEMLNNEHYRDVLSIQKTITLIDARQLADARYTEKETYLQQIAIADVIVGNKCDLYQQSDYERLDQFVLQQDLTQTTILTTCQGAIDYSYLEGSSIAIADDSASDRIIDAHDHDHDEHELADLKSTPLPDGCYVQAINRGEGYVSVGWRLSSNLLFSHAKLSALLTSLVAERIKGAVSADEGAIGKNVDGSAISEAETGD